MPFDLQELCRQVQVFRDDRDWKQFHGTKDMLLALFNEVSELAELQQWQSESELKTALLENASAFEDELADVLYWVLLLAVDFNIDLEKAFLKKMQKNADKYPIHLAKGKKHKYSYYNNCKR